MNLIERVFSRIASAIPGNIALRLDNGPLCSFTFDDCPRSAMLIGGRLLEEAGAEGTYFVSSSMLDVDGSHGMLRPEDLNSLVARGHEIGCHTFSHNSVSGQNRRDLLIEFERNEQNLAKLCGVERLVSFSYPFGEVSFLAKSVVSEHFAVGRGIREGLNHSLLDLAELRACRIFHEGYSQERVQTLIGECKRKSAWLVFYTHDVADRPSRWGCTPAELGEVVGAVRDAGIEIQTMRGAVGRLMFRRPQD